MQQWGVLIGDATERLLTLTTASGSKDLVSAPLVKRISHPQTTPSASHRRQTLSQLLIVNLHRTSKSPECWGRPEAQTAP